ncbi:MAG: trigger factor [Candidatus Rokuibacteriota bacterium]|nr:MAG: trigger factor [Candidatus Rokubacteria bacterium]
MGRVQTQVEELAGDRVRVSVEVPVDDVRHAVDHAASDLAGATKIPGFRKGKVPLPVLIARVGKERLYSEAVESHIGGWLRNALTSTRVRPTGRPEYEYELPESPETSFRFTATLPVQPPVQLADWTTLEVGAPELEVPAEAVEAELEALRSTVAELTPVERPAREGDVAVLDLVSPSGDRTPDTVVELGSGRLVDELEQALIGLAPGETRTVTYEVGDEGESRTVDVTLNELKEKVLPPLDDELARTASEFDTLAELRADIESRLQEQLAEELETEFRVAAVDALARASNVEPQPALVDARASDLLEGLARTLERRGISLETYLAITGRSPEELTQQLRAEAAAAVARELVLEAVADQLGLEVTDEELTGELREQGEEEETIERVLASPARETIREDLRLRKAVNRVASEVKRIPLELAEARDKLWTPEKEKAPTDTKLWTPGQEERT